MLTTEPLVRLEYSEVVGAEDLRPLERLEGEVLVAVAARVGDVRLIDNMTIRVDGNRAGVDLGVTTGCYSGATPGPGPTATSTVQGGTPCAAR